MRNKKAKFQRIPNGRKPTFQNLQGFKPNIKDTLCQQKEERIIRMI